ncbi:MAG: CARDB domain-containing protein [Patescibacteria group bacterium]
MAFNHVSQNRPVDQAIKESQKKLSLFSLISKGQVKVWKATVVSFFIAGFVGALALSVGLDMGMKSQAATKPDLIVSRVWLSSEMLKDGDSVNILADVKNQKGGTAGASFVRFCVDNSNCLNSITGRIGDDQEISSLAWDKSTQVLQAWQAVAGSHTITVCADVDKEVSESNEKNNCKNTNITVNSRWPDLITRDITIYGDTVAGDLTSFGGVVENQGGIDASEFAVRFCIDNANCLNSTAGRVGSEDLIFYSGLKAGETEHRSSDFWIATLGEHTVYYCADVIGVIGEADENNNCTSTNITVGPGVDLLSSHVTMVESGPFKAGDGLHFKGNVKNQGTADSGSGSFYTRFCVDNSNCLNANTGQVGEEEYVSSLSVGQSMSQESDYWVATIGSHTVYLCADVNKTVGESDESNNCGSYSFTVSEAQKVDLISQNVTTVESGPYYSGNALHFKGSVKNQGTTASGSFSTRFCVDNSNCLNANTGRVGEEEYVNTLSAGQTVNQESDYWVATVGSHTVYLCADVGKTVSESSESNNCGSYAFTVSEAQQADLIPQNITLSNPNPFKNEKISFSGVVKNNGNASAGSSSSRFCVDNSNCLNTTTGRVGYNITISSLSAGGSTSVTSSQWTATLGTHTAYLCTDVTKVVTESSEGNNCISVPFTVTTAPLE